MHGEQVNGLPCIMKSPEGFQYDAVPAVLEQIRFNLLPVQ
jgi:hypothetical protein